MTSDFCGSVSPVDRPVERETVAFRVDADCLDDLRWLQRKLLTDDDGEIVRHALVRAVGMPANRRRAPAGNTTELRLELPSTIATSLRETERQEAIAPSERLMTALAAFRQSFDGGRMAITETRSVQNPVVSMVIPVLNEEAAIPVFLDAMDEIGKTLSSRESDPIDLEYLFVNDGSSDGTLDVLVERRTRDRRIRIIDLSRNFGKEAALTAGIQHATGAAVIPIDVDLQDPPEMVIDMVNEWRAGAEVVVARRIRRDEDTNRKRWSAKLFYKFYNSVSPTKLPENVGDFRLIDRSVVEALKSLPENRRFMKGLFAWVGFRSKFLDYDRPTRSVGKTKFSGWSLWNLALDGLTSFSVIPLIIWTYIGFAVAFAAFALAFVIFVQKLFFGLDIPGYAALSIAVFFLGGVQIMGIGILGEYLGRVYSEVKRRPVYLIRRFYGEDADG